MNLKQFIDRPVLSTVISIAIMLAGIVGLMSLPIEQFPTIAPPTINVTTTYPGASAETIQKSVIAPLEEQINGVENMTYMTSTASNTGKVSISVYFQQGTDPDMAAVNVQNRVTRATSVLPAEVTRMGVQTAKKQTSIIKAIGIYSPEGTYDETFLSNYFVNNIQPKLLRINGVGECMTLGSKYSMRIWLKPDVMAQYGLVPSDISAILAEQNIEASTGNIGENSGGTFQYTMRYRGRKVTPEEFDSIVIKSLPTGEVLHLRDVADVEFGNESYAFTSKVNGYDGVVAMLYQTPGSNATQVLKSIDALIAEEQAKAPRDVEFVSIMDSNEFLFASIHEVVKTLVEAIILVILVVFIFLQSVRSSIIPLISIIVSLVGTFAALALLGFSINMLTLFALVLAIGTVVDDAVIVVEAVQAKFEAGYRSAYQATVDAMQGISSAIVTSTLVFMAVFIPVTMMGGTSGIFYTQFGVTMAIAVGISGINALTLSPALCALMLKPHAEGASAEGLGSRLAKAYNTAFDALIKHYKRGVGFFINRKWALWGALIASIVVMVYLFSTTKTGLVPSEDQGTIMVNVTMAPGSTLEQTDKVMEQVSQRLSTIEQVDSFCKISGYGILSGQGSSYGTLILRLKNWEERKEDTDNVAYLCQRVMALCADVKDAQVIAIVPPMISGYGTASGFSLHLQDINSGSVEEFYKVAMQFIGALNQREEIGMAYTTYNVNYPQYMVDVDAAKCKRAGISPQEVLATIGGYYGGQYVSDINRFSKVYRVMLQASPENRKDIESLDNVYVRVEGQMAPVSQFVTLTKMYGPETLNRFNMYTSIAVSGEAAAGYSSGDAIRAIKEVAAEVLPRGYEFEFSDLTREEESTSSNAVAVYGICFLLIYLLLASLYESYLTPFAVLLAVPAGLMGCLLFAKMMGLENNIYLQTGMIMIIGLLSKTAILLTEYATERRKAGMSLKEAAMEAAGERLRPILMTVLMMIFGMLPLMFSTGVGANGNSSLGSGVVGGMLIGTIALLFLVPGLFIAFQWLQERIKPIEIDDPKGEE
ncbi:MAG: efflux RND transporter permease subunit [Rikenellaceae bacterium]|nr:efflux RND transporter permease subunit [Rikenellaceae bacterium]